MAMVASNIEGMATKLYVEEGHVTNVVDYFSVPKGDDDIRVVFDGSSCGLNKALWAPNFYLPSASASRHVAILFYLDGRHGLRGNVPQFPYGGQASEVLRSGV